MTSHKQTSLDCAVRITNTLLIQGLIEGEGLTKKILATAKIFEDYLGPEPVNNRGGFQKREKPTYPEPCPICKGEMYDLSESRKSDKSPIARCKNAGKWNSDLNKYDGCQGVLWPPKS